MRPGPEEDTALFERNTINVSIMRTVGVAWFVVEPSFGGLWWFLYSLQSAAESKDYKAGVAQWSLFFCGYRVPCVLILHLRMGFDKKESIEKVLTLDLPGHYSHSSLHLCPSSFPTTLHLLPTGPPPKPPSQSCGNLCLSSHLLFHWPASITSSALKSLGQASHPLPIQLCAQILRPTWLTLNYFKDHFKQLKFPVYHNASFKLTPIVICWSSQVSN